MSQHGNIDVSVCIPNYNGAAFIASCIDSVYAQNCKLTLEIIVHDDASTDNSLELLRNDYPDIELLIAEKNIGFCASSNRLARHAKGTYLLLLNNDATLYPDAIQTLFEAAQARQPSILTIPQYDAHSGELIDCGYWLDPFANSIPILAPAHQPVAMAIGACLWMPIPLWNELGGFPEWFGSLGEDLYLCCIARLRGVPVVALDKSGYRHIVGQSFGGGKVTQGKLQISVKRRRLTERNKIFVMAICYPLVIAALILPLHFCLLLTEGLILSIARRDLSLLREIYIFAIREFFAKRSIWYAKRQAIQSSTQISTREFLSAFRLLPYKLRMLIIYGLPNLK